MIHAYLFILNVREGNGGHGPNFRRIMTNINQAAGTNITVSAGWMCTKINFEIFMSNEILQRISKLLKSEVDILIFQLPVEFSDFFYYSTFVNSYISSIFQVYHTFIDEVNFYKTHIWRCKEMTLYQVLRRNSLKTCPSFL